VCGAFFEKSTIVEVELMLGCFLWFIITAIKGKVGGKTKK